MGIRSNKLTPITAIIDTVAGAIGINKAVSASLQVPTGQARTPSWTHVCHETIGRRRRCAPATYVRVGDLRGRIWFVVVTTLAVPLPLCKSFIDIFRAAIFQMEVGIVTDKSRSVPILSEPQTAVHVITDTECPVRESTEPVQCRSTKWKKIPIFSQGIVTVE